MKKKSDFVDCLLQVAICGWLVLLLGVNVGVVYAATCHYGKTENITCPMAQNSNCEVGVATCTYIGGGNFSRPSVNCSGEGKYAKGDDFSYTSGGSSRVTKGPLATCYTMQTCGLSEQKTASIYENGEKVGSYSYQECELSGKEGEGGDSTTWKTASESDCE